MIENFGPNIARLRKEFGLSQTQLAEKIEVQKQTISNIERGKRYPTFETLERLADVFHATPVQLFGNAREVAMADTPEIMDRIDQYDQKVDALYRLSRILDRYPLEDLEKIANEISFISNFFTPRPQFYDDGEPKVTKNGEQLVLPPLFDKIPFEKIHQTANELFEINHKHPNYKKTR